MKMKLKRFSHLLLLALCFNCLNASAENSAANEKIEKRLLKQIDEERMAYKLYTELFKAHPEIKILKNMIAAEKRHFSALVNYAKSNHPDLKTGQLNGMFKVRETEKLYDEWLKEGKASSEKAVEVGIELEKMDIEEITDFLHLNPKPELTAILKRLKQGSKKHLAAFRRYKTRN